MADALDDLFGIIVLVVKWFGNFIVSAAKAYAQFKDAWGGIKDWFSGTIVPSLKRAWEQLKDVFGAIGDFFSWWWKRFTDKSTIGSDLVKNAISTMKTNISAILSSIVSTFTTFPGKVVSTLSSLGSRLYTAGANAMKGFLNGLGDMAGAVIGKAKSIADQVISTISGALRIGSPSKVMEQIGQWTMEGFVNGMDKMSATVANYMPAPIQNISNFGSIQNPQMDKGMGSGVTVNNTVYGDVDPWRQAEDMYFVLTSRGGVA
jgi:phage-related protein